MKQKRFNKKDLSVQQKISKWIDGAISVKAGRGLVDLFLKQVITISRLSSARVRSLVCFSRFCHQLYRNQGFRGLIMTLKAMQIALMQSIARNPLRDLGLVGPRFSRTNAGLPRIIPKLDRERIRLGDKTVIRIWMSLFSIYRVIDLLGKPKFKTITDPPKVFDLSKFKDKSSAFFRGFGLGSCLDLDTPSLFPIYSSGATQFFEKVKQSTSFRGIVSGALGVRHDPILWKAFRAVVGSAWIRTCLNELSMAYFKDERFTTKGNSLGRLIALNEPAGKVRVIAMVECWTQFALKPLHDAIFKVLRTLPTDGTYDQLKPIRRLLGLGHKRFWCYDLSAATDRLPISLQVEILKPLVGEEYALAWKTLLVDRVYSFSKEDRDPMGRSFVYYRKDFRYATGQPMGALSSFAMLALTHHILVAEAALRVGIPYGLFKDYAVLGDDIVIANGRVARSYLSVMEEIGVEIGMAKSLVSRNGTLEFAKRFFVDGVDCSPVSLRELLTSSYSLLGKVDFAIKYGLSLPRLLSLQKAGYRTKGWLTRSLDRQSRRIRTLGLLYYSPWGVVKLDELTWFGLNSLVFSVERLFVDHLTITSCELVIQRWRKSIMEKLSKHWAIGSMLGGMNQKVRLYDVLYRYLFGDAPVSWQAESVIHPIPDNNLLTPRPTYSTIWLSLYQRMWEGTWRGIIRDMDEIRRNLYGRLTPTFNDLIIASRVISTSSKDIRDSLNLKKPSLSKRESLKALAYWHKMQATSIELYLENELESKGESQASDHSGTTTDTGPTDIIIK